MSTGPQEQSQVSSTGGCWDGRSGNGEPPSNGVAVGDNTVIGA